MKPLLALAALALFAFPAYADGSSGDTIVQISGSFTEQFTGLGSVAETFSESYQLDETTQTLVPGSMTFSDTGMFGALSLSYFSSKSVVWSDPNGNLVQVTFYEDVNPQPQPGSPAEFWLFGASILVDDDWPGGIITITDVPAATPEPKSLALLAIGLLGLVLLKKAA